MKARGFAGEGKTRDVLDPIDSFGFLLLETSRLYTRRFRERSPDGALNFARFRALVTLAVHDGPTQQQLAELTAIDPAAMGRIVDRLEADGWVERNSHPNDRRARSIAITQAGRELLPLVWRTAQQLQLDALVGLSRQEKETLANALPRVLSNLSSYEADEAVEPP